MQLTLTNFGCWEHKTLVFPEYGNVLISAPSGKGKTTIFRAIQFCLFGGGKKLIRHGCTSCSVELQYTTKHGEELIITRSKPNDRIIVKTSEYVIESEEAEQKIKDIFHSSSLIISEQNKTNHFLSLPNAEQFDFLEKLMFQQFDYTELKEKIKAKLKHFSDTLTNHEQLFQRAEKQKEQMIVPPLVDEIEKPCAHTYKKITEEYNILSSVSLIPQTILTNRRDVIIDQLQHMKKITSQHIDHLHDRIRHGKKWNTYIELEEEYNEQKDQYDESIEREKQDISQRKQQLSQPSVSRNDCIQQKEYYEKWKYIYEMDMNLTDQSTHIQTLKEHILSKKVYQCPKCSIPLRINANEDLVCNTDCYENPNQETLEEQLTILENEQLKYEHRRELLQTCPEYQKQPATFLHMVNQRIETYSSYIQQHDTYDVLWKQYTEEEKNLTCKYSSFYKRLLELYKKYSDMECEEPEETLDELENQLEESRTLLEQRTRLLNELATINDQLAPLETVTEVNVEQRLKELNQLKEKYTADIEQYYQWIQYKEKKDQYQSICHEMDEYHNHIVDIREKLKTVDLFKKYVMTAETIALNTLIQTLNLHVQEYVDAFFIHDPMTVELVTTRSEKSGRYQLRIELHYKQMQPTVEMLSGGEMDRLVLSFTMALNKLNTCPIVMLDESFSSLDHQTAEIVYEYLRKEGDHKLIIMIAHQVVEGQFDQVITL